MALLKKRGYPSDPLKAWKAMVSKDEEEADESQEPTDHEETMDYDYLLGLTMWCLTVEKQQELLKLCQTKVLIHLDVQCAFIKVNYIL